MGSTSNHRERDGDAIRRQSPLDLEEVHNINYKELVLKRAVLSTSLSTILLDFIVVLLNLVYHVFKHPFSKDITVLF